LYLKFERGGLFFFIIIFYYNYFFHHIINAAASSPAFFYVFSFDHGRTMVVDDEWVDFCMLATRVLMQY
jgi:hypothetical protein